MLEQMGVTLDEVEHELLLRHSWRLSLCASNACTPTYRPFFSVLPTLCTLVCQRVDNQLLKACRQPRNLYTLPSALVLQAAVYFYGACSALLRHIAVHLFTDFTNASPNQMTQLIVYQYALCDGAEKWWSQEIRLWCFIVCELWDLPLTRKTEEHKDIRT